MLVSAYMEGINLHRMTGGDEEALLNSQGANGFFFWLVAAWVKSRAERPSVSGVNRQLHVQNRMQIRN